MDKAKRVRIYTIIASTIFCVNLFNVDFDNLSWVTNKRHYINMIVAALVCISILILSKKYNK
jgi:hypothetical protein